MELLLDVNFTLRGLGRQRDREDIYLLAAEMGDLAWASESQFYLLTTLEPFQVQHFLRQLMQPYDFLKIQAVCGQFCVTGLFPPALNALFEIAHAKGIIDLRASYRAPPVLTALLPSPV